MYELNPFGLKSNPDPFYEAQQSEVLVKPETRAVLGAYVDDVYRGLGSQYADDKKEEILELDKKGEALSLGLFEDMGFQGVEWYPGITKESAEFRQMLNKEAEQRAVIQNRASTAQSIAGVVTAIGAGVFEEKNVKYGIAGALVASPLYGAAASAIRSTKTAYNVVKRANNVASMAGRGAMDGFVSAALMEPSNRSTANVLQQDYTMMDTMFNVTTSTLFGAAFGAVPEYARNRFAEMRDKAKAREIALDEFETGVAQLATSQKVDISAVEKAHMGDIATKPIAEKMAAVERSVRYTDTPEFKARFEGSKVVDAEGKPLMVYHGTRNEFSQYRDFIAEDFNEQSSFYFTSSPRLADTYSLAALTENDVPNTRMEYLNIRNPLELDAKGKNYDSIEYNGQIFDMDALVKKTVSLGHDGLIVRNLNDALNYSNKKNKPADVYVAFSPDQIISALGADDADAIARRLDAENKAAIQRHVQSITDVLNDTAFPPMTDREPNVEPKNLRQFYDQNFDKYLQELSEDELEFLNNAIDSYNDADIEEAYKNIYSCMTRG